MYWFKVHFCMCNGAQGIDAFTESSHLIINSSLIRVGRNL